MPALGYLPQGQFAFPRSYLAGIQIRHDIAPPIWTGSTVTFWIAGPPDALCQVTFKNNFFTWNSNRYTMDYIVQSAVYSYPPAPLVLDLPYYLVWVVPVGYFANAILFDVTFGGTYTMHDLPPQPPSYWRPPKI